MLVYLIANHCQPSAKTSISHFSANLFFVLIVRPCCVQLDPWNARTWNILEPLYIVIVFATTTATTLPATDVSAIVVIAGNSQLLM